MAALEVPIPEASDASDASLVEIGRIPELTGFCTLPSGAIEFESFRNFPPVDNVLPLSFDDNLGQADSLKAFDNAVTVHDN